MLAKNAFCNLKNRYLAVLKKCHLLNTFGSLAMVATLTVGAVTGAVPCGGMVGLQVQDAWAADDITASGNHAIKNDTRESGSINVTGDLIITDHTSAVNSGNGVTYTASSGGSVTGSLTIGSSNLTDPVTLELDGDFTVGGGVSFQSKSSGGTTYTGTLQILSGTTTVSGVTNIDNDGTLIVESGATYIAKDEIQINNGTLTNYGTIYGTDVDFGSGTYDVTYGTMILSGTLDMSRDETFEQATIVADTLNAYNENSTQGTKYDLIDSTIIAVNNLTGGGLVTIYGNTDDDDNPTTGSLLVLGSTEYEWVYDAIDEANTNNGANLNSDNLGILAIATPYDTTDKGLLTVGSDYTSSSGSYSLAFGSDSLLVVDATGIGSDYALTSGDAKEDIDVNSGASLLVSNVTFDANNSATVNIAKASGTLSIEGGAWGYDGEEPDDKNAPSITNTIDLSDTNNLYFDSAFIEAASYTYDFSNNTYSLALTQVQSSIVLPLLDKNLSKLIDKAVNEGKLPDYVGNASKLDDKSEAAAIIEGGAKISLGAGVLASLTAVNELGATAVANRLSLVPTSSENSTITQIPVFLADSDNTFTDTPVPMISDAATEGGMVNGYALWLQPLYQSVTVDGFDSGNFEYGFDTDISGVSLGSDYTKDSLRFGLAFHVGAGDTESSNSDFSHTENDFDYFGATAYGAYVMDNFSLSADLGYIMTTNDVVQKSTIGVLSTGDFNAGAFSLGAKAQYKVDKHVVDIVSYLGARLNHCYIDSFNTKDASGTVYYNQSVQATTFAIPMGLIFAKTMEFDDFTLTPKLKAGVQFTMGDLDVTQRVEFVGVSGHASMESEVFDPVTVVGGLGLDFTYQDVNLALEYNVGASEHLMSHQVMATLSYRF